MGREAQIWALTATDKDLVQVLASSPSGNKGAAAAWQAMERRRPPLVQAAVSGLMKADAQAGKELVQVLSRTKEGLKAIEAAAVRHPIQSVRRSAALVSAEWGFKGARPTLRQALSAGEPGSARALGRIGTREDWPLLREYLDRETKRTSGLSKFDIRRLYPREALLSLGRLGEPVAVRQLRAEVDGKGDDYARSQAVEALAARKDKNDLPRFRAALSDDSMRVRFAAAEAVGALRDRSAIPALLKAAARPSKDATQGMVSDQRGRGYMRYVADKLSSGDPPVTMHKWNLGKR